MKCLDSYKILKVYMKSKVVYKLIQLIKYKVDIYKILIISLKERNRKKRKRKKKQKEIGVKVKNIVK
jgi:hypothetical protein